MSRIGLLVLSSNTTVEPEFYRALPPEVTLHVARVFHTPAISSIVQDLEAQSRGLASADVDVIVLVATAQLCLKGHDYDRELIARIEAVSGKRAITASTALIAALQHLGISRVVVGADSDAKVDAFAKASLEANGIEVLAARGLGMGDRCLDSGNAYEVARKLDCPDAEAIVLACTNWKTMDAIEQLERELGKPVISATQASLWAALKMIGRIEGVAGYGQLLRDLTVPSQQTQFA